jgi:hypothetical protein
MGEIMPRGKIEGNIDMQLVRVTEAEMTLEGYQHLEISASRLVVYQIKLFSQTREAEGSPF